MLMIFLDKSRTPPAQQPNPFNHWLCESRYLPWIFSIVGGVPLTFLFWALEQYVLTHVFGIRIIQLVAFAGISGCLFLAGRTLQLAIDQSRALKSTEETLVEFRRAEEELLQLTRQLKREISDRKLAQKELIVKQLQLEKTNQSLTERVKEAVEELRCNDQILITQSRQAAMGEMISNIAHQWRQPLNTIGLIIQYLQRTCRSERMSSEELDKEFVNALGIIMHMSKTIDDFRSFFSPNKSKQTFEVSEAILQALEFSSAYFNNSRIQVDMQAEAGVTIFGYQSEYAQVLLNLLNNARDQLIEHRITEPRITVRSSKRNGCSITTIHDNGGGIPSDIIDRIFDPDFTTKPQGKGSGIGLYMSKTIIEKHMGGELTVSNINGGAEFCIEV